MKLKKAFWIQMKIVKKEQKASWNLFSSTVSFISCLSNSCFCFWKLAPKKKKKCELSKQTTGILHNFTYLRAILSAYRTFSTWLLTLYTGLHDDGDQWPGVWSSLRAFARVVTCVMRQQAPRGDWEGAWCLWGARVRLTWRHGFRTRVRSDVWWGPTRNTPSEGSLPPGGGGGTPP